MHPVENNDVMAGNGTVALEILEDLPGVDAVVVPYGGGGLISGIGSVLRRLRPQCRVLAAEVATAAPLRVSLDAGAPSAIEHSPSFVDGIGGRSVLPAMWPLVRQVVDDSVVVGLDEVEEAIRSLARSARVVAEGAGAASLAAARRARPTERWSAWFPVETSTRRFWHDCWRRQPRRPGRLRDWASRIITFGLTRGPCGCDGDPASGFWFRRAAAGSLRRQANRPVREASWRHHACWSSPCSGR